MPTQLVYRAAINNEFGIQFLNSKITSVWKMDFYHIFTINMNYIHICIIYIIIYIKKMPGVRSIAMKSIRTTILAS